MKIGFVGKGGSGKSTLAALAVRQLLARGANVLAIDADHNVDLGFLLGAGDGGPYLGDAMADARRACGLADGESLAAGLSPERVTPTFSLSPVDPFTERHSRLVSPRLRLMAAGPQTERVMSGEDCSHALAAPLKLYLPRLTLRDGEYAIVDEKASVDAVSTGIPRGFDLTVVCVEPRPQSVRAGERIGAALDALGARWVVVLNKCRDNVPVSLGSLPRPVAMVRDGAAGGDTVSPDAAAAVGQILDAAR